MRRFACLLVLGSVVACGGADPRPSPVGVEEEAITAGATTNDYPAVVGLAYETNGEAGCTGTVIGPRVVLTAAHCVADGTPLEVIFGDPHHGFRFAVRDAFFHQDFDSRTFENDVAVVRLSYDAPVTPVAVGTSMSVTDGETVHVVGYGLDPNATSDSSRAKRIGTSSIGGLDDTSLHLVAAPSRPCVGDSGGPVLATDDAGVDVVVGITSHGDAACVADAIALRVSSVSDFVSAYLREDSDHGAGCAVAVPRASSPSSTAASAAMLVLVLVAARARRWLDTRHSKDAS